MSHFTPPQENLIVKAVMEILKEKQESPTPVKIGDIFRMSWGYDQTNVDYFQVVRLTPKGVVVREIAYEEVPGTNKGGMSCRVRPLPNKYLTTSTWVPNNAEGQGLTRRVGYSNGTAYISMGRKYCAFRLASVEETTYCSWYA